MKKWLALFALIIALASYYHWGKIKRDSQGGNDFKLNNSHQVVLYSTSWCPYCRKARAFFYRRNIAYVEYDIEKSYEAKRQFDELGGRGVPLILVGTEKIPGWNANAVEAALARLKDSAPAQSVPVAVQRTSTISREEKQEERREERREKRYIIHLRNGRKIQVKDYWERGNTIQYRKHGGTIGVDRKHVVMIESQVNGTKKRYSPIFTKQ